MSSEPALAHTYWLRTQPVLLDTLAGDSGLTRADVAELLVQVEQELMQHTNVNDGTVVLTYLDLLTGPPHGKHASLI